MARSRTIGTAVFLGITGSLLMASTAWAHVSITPNTSTPGQSAQVSFRVPNERDDAATVRLEVVFPADRPLPTASVGDVAGWTATVHRQKLATPVKTDDGEVTDAVTSITWEGGRIEPGHFQQFPVSLGRLDAGKLTFKALQTYSNGTVVRWIDGTESGANPEHPAPVLTIATPPAPPVADPGATGTDVFARVLGTVGLLSGLTSLAWWFTGRKRTTDAEPAPVEDRAKAGV